MTRKLRELADIHADGKIVDFKVMVRPLKAIQKVHADMGKMLEKMKEQA